MKKTQIFAGILCLGITATLMTGCGKSGTVVSDKEDDCIVVELPDDYGVRDIFNIVSSTEISVSKEEQTFVYTEKEVNGVEVSHYGNELRDKTPISLEEFDEICESKEG